MKSTALLRLASLAFASCFAAASLSAQVPAPANPGSSRYVALSNCTKRVEAFKSKPCDLIFIGDSITEGWQNAGREVWKKTYEPRNALNFGIGGDSTQDVLWRLDNIDLTHLKPKVAVILIGTNNTKDTPVDIAAGVKAVVAKTQQRFAGVKIVLVGILPNARATEKMAEASKLTHPLADGQSVIFLDLAAQMTPIVTTAANGKSDTNWKGLLPDHLHLTSEGYQLWADTLQPVLKKLL